MGFRAKGIHSLGVQLGFSGLGEEFEVMTILPPGSVLAMSIARAPRKEKGLLLERKAWAQRLQYPLSKEYSGNNSRVPSMI